MIKSKTGIPVNIESEMNAIVDYFTRTWTVDPQSTQALVIAVFKAGGHAAENWFDDHDVLVSLSETRKQREEHLKLSVQPSYVFYDRTLQDLERLSSAVSPWHRQVMKGWNFEKKVTQVLSPVKVAFPELRKAVPIGYLSSKTENDPCEIERVKRERSLEMDFKGHDFAGAMSFGLPIAAGSEGVTYNEDHGRDPFNTMVSVIFGHALMVQQHNNTAEILNEIKEIPLTSDFQNDTHSPVDYGKWLNLGMEHVRKDWPLIPLTEDLKKEMDLNAQRWSALSKTEQEEEINRIGDAIISDIIAEDQPSFN